MVISTLLPVETCDVPCSIHWKAVERVNNCFHLSYPKESEQWQSTKITTGKEEYIGKLPVKDDCAANPMFVETSLLICLPLLNPVNKECSTQSLT